jgi:hypothetical protein
MAARLLKVEVKRALKVPPAARAVLCLALESEGRWQGSAGKGPFGMSVSLNRAKPSAPYPKRGDLAVHKILQKSATFQNGRNPFPPLHSTSPFGPERCMKCNPRLPFLRSGCRRGPAPVLQQERTAARPGPSPQWQQQFAFDVSAGSGFHTSKKGI